MLLPVDIIIACFNFQKPPRFSSMADHAPWIFSCLSRTCRERFLRDNTALGLLPIAQVDDSLVRMFQIPAPVSIFAFSLGLTRLFRRI